jgi:hypothetical protein
MAKKRKRKQEQPKNETYEIEVEDWEVDYYFALNTGPEDLFNGAYMEHSNLVLTGNIFSPSLEKVGKTRIEITADPQMDDFWKPKPTIISAKAIGWMEIPRGDDTLIFHCSVPSRSLLFIALAVKAGKINYISIFGSKLKWRQGAISSISVSTNKEDE